MIRLPDEASKPTTLRVEFSQSATDDARIAADWLDEVQSGLGRSFLESIDEVLQRIIAHPEMYQKVHGGRGDCRRAVLRRFDYALVYRICPRPDPDLIQVVGILHCRLNPAVMVHRASFSHT